MDSLWAKLAGGTPVHYICDEKSNWYPNIADMEKKSIPEQRELSLLTRITRQVLCIQKSVRADCGGGKTP